MGSETVTTTATQSTDSKCKNGGGAQTNSDACRVVCKAAMASRATSASRKTDAAAAHREQAQAGLTMCRAVRKAARAVHSAGPAHKDALVVYLVGQYSISASLVVLNMY